MNDGPAAVIVDVTGTHIAAVLPSTTAAVATDKPLVVALHPTSPVTVTSLPLPTGAATAALQTQPGVDIGDVTINNAGQQTMAASVPVVLASDQPPITVTFTPAGSRDGVSAGKIVLGGATTGTLNVMRSTAYNEPAAAAQRSISSASAADTAAGTGAHTVEITYYDGTGAGPFTETVTLNGTTFVATVATDIRFIEKMEVKTAGSGGVNAGVITLFVNNTGGGGTVGTIGVGNVVTSVGDNRTLWAHHYVATGQTAHFSVLVAGVISGGSATNGQLFLRKRSPLVANSAEVILGDIVLAIGAFTREFTFNPAVEGFAQIIAYGIPGTNNATLTASFDWSEVDT